jgi:hypothetical protein
MSKGLGAVESTILDALDQGGSASIHGLADWIFGNVGSPRAQYESVRRAVRSLERKGLVRTEWSADVSGDRPQLYLQVSKINKLEGEDLTQAASELLDKLDEIKKGK